MDEHDAPQPMNLTPVVIHKDEIIHLLQSGILCLPKYGIELHADMSVFRSAAKVKTRVNGGRRIGGGKG